MRVFKAPTCVNLVITETCNAKCHHCLNYWRHDENRSSKISNKQLDRLIDMFAKAGVFHVVINGGEPLTHTDTMFHALERLQKKGITVGANSNLMLANEETLKRLFDTGLDHILTSLNSYDAATCDYMLNIKGALSRIIKGIEMAVNIGFRVSANMIISQPNLKHVFQTGLLAHELGCTRFFGTRMIPATSHTDKKYWDLSKQEIIQSLDDMIHVKEETGIMIGSLTNYPLCLLGDLNRYRDFVGRGCPTQRGHRISINPNGDFCACPHESTVYGNVFETGIIEAWKRINKWHTKKLRNPGCKGCEYTDVCGTGCRVSSFVHHGTLKGQDPLMLGKSAITTDYKFIIEDSYYKEMDNGANFFVPKHIRFREEDGFYLLNIRWANTIPLETDTAEFLIHHQQSGEYFTLETFGRENRDLLANLYFKDAVESTDMSFVKEQSQCGSSFDPSALK